MGGFNQAVTATSAAPANNDFLSTSAETKTVGDDGFGAASKKSGIWPAQDGGQQAQTPSAAISRNLLESAGSFSTGGQTLPGDTGNRRGDDAGWLGTQATKPAQPLAPRQRDQQLPESGLLTSLVEAPRQSKPINPLDPPPIEAAKKGGILEMMSGYPQWREGYLRNYDKGQQEFMKLAEPKTLPLANYANNVQAGAQDGSRSGDDRFDKIVRGTYKREGGYVNDKDDYGGETNLGVTATILKAYQNQHGGLGRDGAHVDVESLTQEQAKQVYKTAFYDSKRIGEIKDDKTAEHVFDMNVLHQPKPTGKIIQHAINASVPGANLEVDGIVGSRTIAQMNKATPEQLKAINNEIVKGRIDLMRKIVQNDPSQAKYLRGWINRANQFRQP